MLNVGFGCSLALNKPVQFMGTEAYDWREKTWNNLSQTGPRHRWQGSQSRYRPIAPGNFTESFAPLGPVDSGSFFMRRLLISAAPVGNWLIWANFSDRGRKVFWQILLN
jgi:hypothetical protein